MLQNLENPILYTNKFEKIKVKRSYINNHSQHLKNKTVYNLHGKAIMPYQLQTNQVRRLQIKVVIFNPKALINNK